MIGRRINGEQAEHLARFMDLHRQAEAEDFGNRSDKPVGIALIVIFAAYLLANIFEVVV